MKLDVNISKTTLWAISWICVTLVVCFITFAVWKYNIKAVKMFTENNYEEISDKGTSVVYWRKATK